MCGAHIIKLLLEYKAEVKKYDIACAIHTATDPEQLCIIEVLLQYVIDTNVTNVTTNNDWTPLTIAALKGDIQTAKLQIEHNTELGLKKGDGATATDHLGVVEPMIAHSADREVKNENGDTTLRNDCNGNTVRDDWWKAPLSGCRAVFCFLAFCVLTVCLSFCLLPLRSSLEQCAFSLILIASFLIGITLLQFTWIYRNIYTFSIYHIHYITSSDDSATRLQQRCNT